MDPRVDVAPNGTAQQLPLAAVLTAGPDQAPLRALVRPFAAVAYVYAGLDALGEGQRELRWRRLAGELERDGATAEATAGLAFRVAAAPEAPVMLAVFTDDDGNVLHEQRIRRTGLPDRAGYAAPAKIVPLLAWGQDHPPFVLAVVDRAGAELTVSGGADRAWRTRSVAGPDNQIEHNAPGGWSQPRYQRRAEDSWQHNASRVAEEIARSVAEVDAQVLALSGDVRMVQLLTEHLPDDPGLLVCHVTGGRSADGSQTGRAAQVEHVLADAAATQTKFLLDHFQSRLDPYGLAVEGRAVTLEALAAGRVSTLLLTELVDESDRAWFGAGPTDIYPDHDTAELAGIPVRSGPLADVAARAALLSDAHVRMIPAGAPGQPIEGIGAICRYPLPRPTVS